MSGERPTRSHNNGELNEKDLDQEVVLCGWVQTRRDHGGLVFVDLRDRYGLTQVVFDPKLAGGVEAHKEAGRLRQEFVMQCKGKVRKRPDGMTNSNLPTGQIEVACTELRIFSEAKTPPFEIDDDIDVSENLRLKYRYLDLRRPSLQRNMAYRHKVLTSAREFLNSEGFIEIETPILYKSTPEGARDFIVPSRMNPGEFFALPQSPQTMKQLLMVSGFDRYYQIARCFRDEDLRADRQPEFSQIDIETSFLDEEAFCPLMEGMVKKIWKDVVGEEIRTPFQTMSYHEAMTRFGSDRPDLRFDLELQDLSPIFEKSGFQVFQKALTSGPKGRTGAIRALVVEGKAAEFSRKDLDDLTKLAGRYGAQGLLWMKVQEGKKLQSPAAKFFSEEETDRLFKDLSLKKDDLILCVADPKDKIVCNSLGALRLDIAERTGLMPKLGEGENKFLWVNRFPLLDYDEAEGRYFALHHPFTAPREEQVEQFLSGEDLDQIEASAYDMVLNGAEVAGGSLRIYRNDVQAAMFKALGMSAEEAKQKFGFFLNALEYGTPPHGGIAFGIERLVGMVCGEPAIREVMAFPKTQKGTCLMSETPSPVQPEQLAELAISVRKHGNKK